MTKAELIELLQPFNDNDKIGVAGCSCPYVHEITGIRKGDKADHKDAECVAVIENDG